jgi:hypothetical protein
LKEDYVLEKKPYGNHKMYSIKDKFLAHVDTKRMNWYLDRDLAVMLNEKDFKLTFKSKGNKSRGKYYSLELKNICVICGNKEQLTKHHVVPSQYRKYLPLEYKSKSSFDVLCVCIDCHHSYEISADELKSQLLMKYGLSDHNKDVNKIKSLHTTLNRHSEYLPDDKRSEMVEYLEGYFDKSIEEILEDDSLCDFESTTALFMKNITDYKSFVIMWREHFIDNAKPKFLPQEWVDEMNIVISL